MALTKDIKEYRLTYKLLKGQTLKLFFQKINSSQPDKVLELKNLAAFIDDYRDGQINMLDIRDTAGSYGTDMAIQLKRPEIQKFNEVFLFMDSDLINFSFRALAEEVIWRDFDINSKDKNY